MKLTGKAKELFEKWAITTDYLDEFNGQICYDNKHQLIDLKDLPESMQWGVIQDFADTVGFYLVVTPDKHIEGEYYFLVAEYGGDDYDGKAVSREAARQAAVEYFIDRLNEKLDDELEESRTQCFYRCNKNGKYTKKSVTTGEVFEYLCPHHGEKIRNAKR